MQFECAKHFVDLLRAPNDWIELHAAAGAKHPPEPPLRKGGTKGAAHFPPLAKGGLGGVVPAEPGARFAASGRLDRRNYGVGRGSWLCPVHPPDLPFASIGLYKRL